ncbi:MAG: DUF423 domain-containing protein [Opitutaceae bacterium]
MNYRTTLLAAGLLGASAVIAGAFGAHALREFLLEQGMASAWETGARYQLFHAIALLAAAFGLRLAPSSMTRRISWAAICWCIGTVLFSGSLYGLAAGGPRWLGPVTPVGGIALLAGWICIVAAGFTKEK